MTGFMEFPFVEGEVLTHGHKWRKASVLRRPRLGADPVFKTGAASLYLPAFLKCRIQNEECRIPSRDVSFCTLHSGILHLENGCQTWTRTKTSGLTGRRATLTLPGNGAAGRIGFPSPASQLPNKRR